MNKPIKTLHHEKYIMIAQYYLQEFFLHKTQNHN
jgi:hypothetical protein